jgi:guanosine-3',5'-bis(diphosphate) 3'-pyrophosphohydrolase
MESIQGARSFAIEMHGGQLYGDRPYSFHLDQVAEIASSYGHQAETLAFLHDTVEDTSATLDEVRERFGSFIADCVALLTDQPGENRKERKAKTYAKLAEVNDERQLALIVKAADRLANVRACVADGNERLLSVYRGEHEVFKLAAFRAGLCDELWGELGSLLSLVGPAVPTSGKS